MPIRFDRSIFDVHLRKAIESLPEEFRKALNEIRIEVRDRPTPQLLRQQGLGPDELLLGLYEGVPLTERSVNDSGIMPERILLFHEDLEDACVTESQLIDEIRITLLHELGHYFGMDEDDLVRLGFG